MLNQCGNDFPLTVSTWNESLPTLSQRRTNFCLWSIRKISSMFDRLSVRRNCSMLTQSKGNHSALSQRENVDNFLWWSNPVIGTLSKIFLQAKTVQTLEEKKIGNRRRSSKSWYNKYLTDIGATMRCANNIGVLQLQGTKGKGDHVPLPPHRLLF